MQINANMTAIVTDGASGRRHPVPSRHRVHGLARHQRLRHDPRLHLIRPLPVPTAAAASREKLQCRLHGETPSQQSSRSNEPISMPRGR